MAAFQSCVLGVPLPVGRPDARLRLAGEAGRCFAACCVFWILLCSGGAFISNSRSYLSQCQALLNRITSVKPQTEIDGLKNIWIIKPAAKSRGRGESSPGDGPARGLRARVGVESRPSDRTRMPALWQQGCGLEGLSLASFVVPGASAKSGSPPRPPTPV